MSLARHAKRRDANENAIVTALHDVGAVTWKLDKPADLLCGYLGRWLTLEVKDGAKPPSARALTPSEQQFMASCAYHRLPHHVVTSVDEALSAIGATHGAR